MLRPHLHQLLPRFQRRRLRARQQRVRVVPLHVPQRGARRLRRRVAHYAAIAARATAAGASGVGVQPLSQQREYGWEVEDGLPCLGGHGHTHGGHDCRVGQELLQGQLRGGQVLGGAMAKA